MKGLGLSILEEMKFLFTILCNYLLLQIINRNVQLSIVGILNNFSFVTPSVSSILNPFAGELFRYLSVTCACIAMCLLPDGFVTYVEQLRKQRCSTFRNVVLEARC